MRGRGARWRRHPLLLPLHVHQLPLQGPGGWVIKLFDWIAVPNDFIERSRQDPRAVEGQVGSAAAVVYMEKVLRAVNARGTWPAKMFTRVMRKGHKGGTQ